MYVIFVETSDGLSANISNYGYSIYNISVKNSPYAFVALYTLKYGVGIYPANDVTFTIADFYFLYNNYGINLLLNIVIGIQFIVIVLYTSSSEIKWNLLNASTPTLFINILISLLPIY